MKHPFTRLVKAPKRHLLYSRWNNIKQFVNNPNHMNYHLYGGKSIKMCEEWLNNYLSFLIWATKNGYKSNLVLLRKDKSKGFYPDNCFFGKHSHDTDF